MGDRSGTRRRPPATSRMFPPCMRSMGKLVPKGPRMPTCVPRSARLRNVVRFPTARMQSSMSSWLLGDDEMEMGASPMPGSSSMMNWPGRKEKCRRSSLSRIRTRYRFSCSVSLYTLVISALYVNSKLSRSALRWYLWWRGITSWNARRWSISVLLSPDARDHLGHGDAGETGLAAAAAAHAERLFIGLDEPAVLVVVAVLEPAAPFGPEVVAAGDLGEIHEVAGIERLGLLRVLEAHIHGLFHAVAVAGGADAGAGAAAQALVAP